MWQLYWIIRRIHWIVNRPIFYLRRWEVRRHLPMARDEDVVRIGKEVDRRHLLDWWFWLWLIVCAIGGGALGVWTYDLVEPAVGDVLGSLVGVGIMIGALLVFTLLVMYREQSIARNVAREYGYRVCVGCGYDLRAAREDAPRCPECGAEREQ